MCAEPRLPNPGTDCDRLLMDLQAHYPAVAWNVYSRLNVMAHSRVPDLRNLGWTIESVRATDPKAAKGTRWGYRLLTPMPKWPVPPAERTMRVIRKGRVVA